MGSIIRILVVEYQEAGREILPADLPDFLASAAAICHKAFNSTIHSVTKVMPRAFAYQCNMFLPVQCIANWECIHDCKSMHIHKHFMLEN